MTSRPSETEAPPSFEEALARLETIVGELEGGALSLQDSLNRYEEGMQLSRQLTQTLDDAEKRIERLEEAPGQPPRTRPLELKLEAQPGATRGRPSERSDPPPPLADEDDIPF